MCQDLWTRLSQRRHARFAVSMLPICSSNDNWFFYSPSIRHAPEHVYSSRTITEIPSCPFSKRVSNEDIQYVLLIGKGIILSTSDASADWSAHFEWCPHAKIHHVAVLTMKFVTFNPLFFLRCYSILVTKFRISLTSGDNRFVMSSCSDCSRSPDVWRFGLWDSLRSDYDEAFCCFLFWHPIITFQLWGFWFCDLWIHGASWKNAIGHPIPDLDFLWPLTSDYVLSWAEINGELLSCRTAACERTLLSIGFDFDDGSAFRYSWIKNDISSHLMSRQNQSGNDWK